MSHRLIRHTGPKDPSGWRLPGPELEILVGEFVAKHLRTPAFRANIVTDASTDELAAIDTRLLEATSIEPDGCNEARMALLTMVGRVEIAPGDIKIVLSPDEAGRRDETLLRNIAHRPLYRTGATCWIRQEGGAKKGGNLLCRPKPVRFAFIDAWKELWSVEFLYRVMQVSSRGFRVWRVRPMSQRQRSDMVILAQIREQHRLSLQSYGRPRITEELQELGLKVGHRRIGRLMRENGIKIIRTQKFKVTTDSNHAFNIVPNLLDQDFSADGPNQKWAGDISYTWTSEGWLYLAVILYLYSRRVIGWPPSRRYCVSTAGQWSATV